MRALYDTISSITMTNEDGSFPIANSQTEFQGQLSKATGTTSTLDISVDDFGNAVFIGNTNATQATIRVYDYLNALQETETVYFDYQDTLTYNITGESRQGFIEMFHTFTNQDENYRLEIDLVTDAAALEFGIVRAGFAGHWSSPDYGWSNSSQDTSIINRTNNGARYVKNRQKIRTFSGNFMSLDHAEFMKWQDLFIKNANKNLALDFWDNANTRQIVFGSINQTPNKTFNNPGVAAITINIEESL